MFDVLFLNDIDRTKKAIRECNYTELERLAARMPQTDLVQAVDFTVFKHQRLCEIIMSRLSDSRFYRIKLLRKMLAEIQGLNIGAESLARLLGAFTDADFLGYFSQDGFHTMALCCSNQLFKEAFGRRLSSCCNTSQIVNEFFGHEDTQSLDENLAGLAFHFLTRVLCQNDGYVRGLEDETLCRVGRCLELVKKLVGFYSLMHGFDRGKFTEFLSALRLSSDAQREVQLFTLENVYCRNAFRAVVEAYGANTLVETTQGWNIAMAAAKEGDLDLLKWVLEQKDGRKLLHYKTYNGKTAWDFAAESKNGAIMNLVRDFHYKNREGSWENGSGKGWNGPQCGADYRVKRHRTVPDFDSDLTNPNSKLHALMIKKGYAGRPQAFAAVAKNPNNELHLILKGLGYEVAHKGG